MLADRGFDIGIGLHGGELAIQGWPDGIKGCHISDDSLNMHPMRCPPDKVTVLLAVDGKLALDL